jgi:hypothetical protein
MAFVLLRRSRNTRSYVLAERDRDERGRVRSRVLCYLGREQDGTDTLERALVHWENVRRQSEAALPTATGKRRQVLTRRLAAIDKKVAVITQHQRKAAAAAEMRRRRAAQAEEANYWRAFETLRRAPTIENAGLARRAFLFLAMRCHPDQGGSHDAFLRLKRSYDAALAEMNRQRVS